MERYSHLQTLPNSPLTPLTPLKDNTAFDFNFGGDGSLDVYIDNIRHKHRVEKHQKSKQQAAANQLEARRYSENFLKLRDVFEPHNDEKSTSHCKIHLSDAPATCLIHGTPAKSKMPSKQRPQPVVKIVQTAATPTKKQSDYIPTPKNVRTGLKQRNYNVPVNNNRKVDYQMEQMRKQQKYHDNMGSSNKRAGSQNQIFRLGSPVAPRPLSPRISKFLQHCGLNMYSALFQKEDIDMFTFEFLQRHDLHQIGITNPKHCDILLNTIRYAKQF